MAKSKSKIAEIISPFNWDETMKHLETLLTTNDKIKHLIEQKTSYQQSGFDFMDWSLQPGYEQKCELEIKKLRAILELQTTAPAQTKAISKFKLKEGIVSKADFIRIINVLSEMRAFENEDKKLIDKKDLMVSFGNLVGLDLSNYPPDLNKALGQSEQANTEIFEKMKDKAGNIWDEKLKKGTK